MDSRDIALQSVTPTVMVPRYGDFEPLGSSGHRFLAAADGLWLEARRPWCYLRRPLAQQCAVAMPYGRVEAVFESISIPFDLVRGFIAAARKRLPNEAAAWIVWQQDTGQFSLRLLPEIEAGPGSIRFHRPVLVRGEHVVVDIHSHGTLPAFFSATDDRDDKGEVKFSCVVGNIDADEPSLCVRLCAIGYFEPIAFPAERLACSGGA